MIIFKNLLRLFGNLVLWDEARQIYAKKIIIKTENKSRVTTIYHSIKRLQID